MAEECDTIPGGGMMKVLSDDLDDEMIARLAELDGTLRQGIMPDSTIQDDATIRLLQEVRQCYQHILLLPDTGSKEDKVFEPQMRKVMPGLQSIGRFQDLKVLGSGGQGTVFLAKDPKLKREVAIKIPRWHAVIDPKHRRRFEREARLAANLKHQNIVPLFETGEEDGTTFLVSEFVRGPSLAEWIASLENQQLPPHTAAEIVRCLSIAVQFMHEHGIIHRDLKPSNVLLESAIRGRVDQWGTPKLTDFGLSHEVDKSVTATAAGAILGTLAYMAPEQATGSPISPSADVYSLGVILFELLTGEKPYWGITDAELLRELLEKEIPSLRTKRKDIPRDLEGICQKCLAKSPLERYRGAEDLAKELDNYLHGRPVSVRPISRVERLSRWIRNRPVVAGLTIASLLLFVALLISVVVYNQDMRKALMREKDHSDNADRERAKAEQTAERLTDVHYASTLREATRYLEAGQRTAVIDKLAEALPEAGQADRRDFAWRALRNAAWESKVTYLSNSTASVDELILAPDNRHIVSLASDFILRMRNVDTGQVTVLNHDDELYRRVQQVPSSDFTMVSYDNWGRFTLWGWDGSALKRIVQSPKRKLRNLRETWPSRIAVSADGRYCAIIDNGILVLYDSLVKSYLYHEFEESRSWHQCDLAFASNSIHLYAVIDGCRTKYDLNKLYIFNIPSLTLTKAYDVSKGDDDQCRGLFIYGKSVFLIGNTISRVNDHEASLCNEKSMEVAGVVIIGSHAIPPAPFETHGSHLYYGSLFGDVIEIDLDTFRKRSLAKHVSPCYGMIVNDLVCVSWDAHDIHMVNRKNGEVRKIAIPPELKMNGGRNYLFSNHAALSNECKILFLGGEDGRIAALQLDDKIRSQQWNHGPGNKEAWSVAISPNSTILASAGDDRLIHLWNATDGKLIRSLGGHKELVSSITFSPDGKLLAACDYHNDVKLWSVEDGRCVHTFETLPAQARSVTFSHSGKHVAVVGKKGFIMAWNVVTRKKMFHQTVDDTLFSVNFTPDDSHIVVAGEGQYISEWDLSSGQLRRKMIEPDQVYQIQMHDNKLVAVGKARQISCWIMDHGENMKLLWRQYDPDAPVRSVALSPDGKTVATSNEMGTIRLWQASTGHELSRLQAGKNKVHSIKFSPDGNCLASGSFDGMIRLFWGK